MASPGMTAQDSTRPQIYPTENTMFLQCLYHIDRAGWLIPTGIGQMRRKNCLIETNQRYENLSHTMKKGRNLPAFCYFYFISVGAASFFFTDLLNSNNSDARRVLSIGVRV